MAQPESKANHLTELLNAVDKEQGLSELEHFRFLKEAKSLLKGDQPERGYDALGMIAALKHDVNESVANHKRAIRINPHSSMLNLNFAVSYDRLGRTGQAIYYAKRALECNPDQEDCNHINGLLFELYFKAGLVKCAKEFWESGSVPVADDQAEDLEKQYKNICVVYDFMQRHAISDNDLERYTRILENLLGDRSIPCIVYPPVASETEEAALISLTQRIKGDATDAVGLNLILAEQLASQEALPEQVTNLVAGAFLAGQA